MCCWAAVRSSAVGSQSRIAGCSGATSATAASVALATVGFIAALASVAAIVGKTVGGTATGALFAVCGELVGSLVGVDDCDGSGVGGVGVRVVSTNTAIAADTLATVRAIRRRFRAGGAAGTAASVTGGRTETLVGEADGSAGVGGVEMVADGGVSVAALETDSIGGFTDEVFVSIAGSRFGGSLGGTAAAGGSLGFAAATAGGSLVFAATGSGRSLGFSGAGGVLASGAESTLRGGGTVCAVLATGTTSGPHESSLATNPLIACSSSVS